MNRNRFGETRSMRYAATIFLIANHSMEGLGPSPIGGFWPSLEGTDASDFCGSLPEPSPLLFISSSLASKSLYLWAGVRVS
ncbi:hypothetical protein LR48_Vigan98s000700 [Vigna angularis]|uniref:Uncharacterized protein n=1 Tax=Phaseolus angularis TaxID=3914 RepID=A0A0L9T410_PHAAN|nr:hypothetical protein LR48_Vigan98s000700 [Vigna angularis]